MIYSARDSAWPLAASLLGINDVIHFIVKPVPLVYKRKGFISPMIWAPSSFSKTIAPWYERLRARRRSYHRPRSRMRTSMVHRVGPFLLNGIGPGCEGTSSGVRTVFVYLGPILHCKNGPGDHICWAKLVPPDHFCCTKLVLGHVLRRTASYVTGHPPFIWRTHARLSWTSVRSLLAPLTDWLSDCGANPLPTGCGDPYWPTYWLGMHMGLTNNTELWAQPQLVSMVWTVLGLLFYMHAGICRLLVLLRSSSVLLGTCTKYVIHVVCFQNYTVATAADL